MKKFFLGVTLFAVSSSLFAQNGAQEDLRRAEQTYRDLALDLPFSALRDPVRTQAQSLYREALQAIRDASRDVNSPDAAARSIDFALDRLMQTALLVPVATLDRDRQASVLNHYSQGQALLISARDAVKSGDQPDADQRLQVAGFWAVGSEFNDPGSALSSWSSACERLRATLFALIEPSTIESFDCGTYTNVSHYSSIGYYAYGSTPTLNLRYAARSPAVETTGAYVVGGEYRADVSSAAKAWYDTCEQEMRRLRATYRERFLAASCGQPRNVSASASIDYYQFGSTAKAWLRSLDATP